jgi:integrase
MTANAKRNDNRGLRKRCACPRAKWPKCKHSWHFNYKPKKGIHKGVHFRISLDKHTGCRIVGRIEAESEAAKVKVAIDEGRFGVELPARDALSIGQLLALYVRDYVAAERPRSLRNIRYQVGAICATPLELPTGEGRLFGAWHVRDVVTGALEKFRAVRRVQTTVTSEDRDGQQRARLRGGARTADEDLSLLRAAFGWAVRLGYVDATPFKRGTESVIKLSKGTRRRRRLEGDECDRLLQACDPLLLNPKTKAPLFPQPRPRLRPIVEAALESGCRRGELLSLQWEQVKDLDGVNPRLDLPAAKTKTKSDRVVPISTRLRAILEMRRTDPAGVPHGPSAYVFGNEIGQRTKSIKTAWRLACQRAGIVDLRFHDLRREAGSRWLEGGVPLQVVREWLGHTNISQTSTYLESTLSGQHDAMRRFDEARALATLRPPSDATPDLVQRCATEVTTRGAKGARLEEGSNRNPQETVN